MTYDDVKRIRVRLAHLLESRSYWRSADPEHETTRAAVLKLRQALSPNRTQIIFNTKRSPATEGANDAT